MSIPLHIPNTRPKEAGVYIIRSTANPSITYYVGSASRLSYNLLPTHHHIIRHCRRELIDATLDCEVEPEPSKRKTREYQLIKELSPVFNVGALPLESASSDSGWQNDTYSLALQLMGEGVSPHYKQGTPEYQDEVNHQMNEVFQWFEHSWDYFSEGAIPELYESYMPNSRAWKASVEKDFGVQKYIDAVTSGDNAEVLPYGSNRLWVESEPGTRGEGSTMILKYISEAIHGEEFDLDAPNPEERFHKEILHYLDVEFQCQWDSFKHACKTLHGHTDADIDFWMPDIIQDYCDHILMWHQTHRLPLFTREFSPMASIYTKFFLEGCNLQKHMVEDYIQTYIPVSAFILGAEEFFESHRLQYRIKEGYNPDRDYLCHNVELRLI